MSVISQKQPELLNSLDVHYSEQGTRELTVCLSPLYFNYSIHYELIQWIELNKLLGIDFFYVYNYSTVGDTDVVLDHYTRKGWLKVIPWHLPVDNIHNHGQMAMVNDCLFRNYKASMYFLTMDIDEFIVPRKGVRKLKTLLNELPSNYCEYNFRSSIMVSETEEDFNGKAAAKILHLDVLLKMLRRQYIFPRNVRSKYVSKPSCVDTAGIHYNWVYKGGDSESQRYHVAPHDGLVFHFRNEPIAKNGSDVVEKAVYKYRTQLIYNVKQRWKKINSEGKIVL